MILAYTAIAFAFGLGALAVLRKPGALASWVFLLGMGGLGLESMLSFRVGTSGGVIPVVIEQLERALVVGGIANAFWLTFSLVYARGNSDAFLRRWKWLLVVGFLLPLAIGLSDLTLLTVEGEETLIVAFSPWGRAFVFVFLAEIIFVIVNLEKTFRAAVGTTRWRVKYVFLGLGLLLSVRLYALSQILLFGMFDLEILSLEAVSIIVACLLMAVAYGRGGLAGLELYPSREILQGSITIILIGVYLFTIGVFAQVVRYLGGSGSLSFQGQAFIVLLGFAGMAILLLSDRLRQRLNRFVGRHFHRPTYDFRKAWTRFNEESSGVIDVEQLGSIVCGFFSETFRVLDVGLFVFEAQAKRLDLAYGTREQESTRPSGESDSISMSDADLEELLGLENPFDLEKLERDWARELREANPRAFEHGGDRFVLTLSEKTRFLGLVVLADRVNGVSYSEEERDLLRCLGRHISTILHNIEVNRDLVQAKEMEAFQTMSTFFVHDLKNAANSLALTLGNFSRHFDNPEFRADALRSIEKSLGRIKGLISKLSALRGRLILERSPCNLNSLVSDVIDETGGASAAPVNLSLEEGLPLIPADGEQLKSVLRNLFENAKDATNGIEEGEVRISTFRSNGCAHVTVEDDGHGMSREFLRDGLFHPFRSTKKKGLGIGMYQSKMIVEAHSGSLTVESEPDVGTVFRLSIPIAGDFKEGTHENENPDS